MPRGCAHASQATATASGCSSVARSSCLMLSPNNTISPATNVVVRDGETTSGRGLDWPGSGGRGKSPLLALTVDVGLCRLVRSDRYARLGVTRVRP